MKQPQSLFISWSGKRSKTVADALRTVLKAHYAKTVEPWMSDGNIAPGRQWCAEILKALKASKFAIICITPENIDSPWLAFEAGAIAQKMKDTHVVPYLCGVEPMALGKSPLANWQAVRFDNQDENRRLFEAIAALGTDLEEAVAKERAFTAAWTTMSDSRNRMVASQSGDNVPSGIIAALRQLKDMSHELTRTHYANTFPHFIREQICPAITNASSEIRISCDFPAYGSFSDHPAYQSYSKILEEHRKKDGFELRVMVPNRSKRDELVRRQFGNDEAQFQLKKENGSFARLLRDFELRCGKRIDSLEDFVKRALGLQDLLIEDYMSNGGNRSSVEIREMDRILSMHMWVVDEAEAFFSFPMLTPDAEEHGIRTQDRGLVQALIGIWDNYWDQGAPANTNAAGKE